MIKKSSPEEQRYFFEQELARLERLRAEHMAKSQAEERRKQKELHFMHCAKCGQQMEVEQMGDIEVEVCPDCGGIYLDAGELPKLLNEKERAPFAEALGMFKQLWKGDKK